MKKIDFESLILFEDKDYIVINKPPYLASLEVRNSPEACVLDLARSYFKKATLCHRLDKETSGILVIAKNTEAMSNLGKQFENRSVEKFYHAFTDGIHSFSNLTLSKPLATTNKGLAVINFTKGKKAVTVFNSLKFYKKNTLVECQLLTGRLHQIRAHLSFLNAPIINDLDYGGNALYLSSLKKGFNLKKNTDEKPLINRVALHSFKISFLSVKGSRVSYEAPYPKDIKALESQLLKY